RLERDNSPEEKREPGREPFTSIRGSAVCTISHLASLERRSTGLATASREPRMPGVEATTHPLRRGNMSAISSPEISLHDRTLTMPTRCDACRPSRVYEDSTSCLPRRPDCGLSFRQAVSTFGQRPRTAHRFDEEPPRVHGATRQHNEGQRHP